MIQLIQGVRGKDQLDIGGKLSGNAAHILPTVDLSLVGTAGQVAAGTPHDAAHVVAHMGIAHCALIGAV